MWLPSIVKMKALQWLTEKNNRLRTAMVVLASLVCLDLLVYGLMVVPSVARLKTGKAAAVELRRRHAEAVLFKRQRPLFTGIMAGMPTQNDMPLLVKDFVQNARRLHLSVDSVKYDMPKRAGGEQAMLVFSFPAEGRYPDIKRFIFYVETSGRLVGVKTLKLTAEKGRVKMDMKLVTYVKRWS
jgi:Tfp pilus assembly protein PilO